MAIFQGKDAVRFETKLDLRDTNSEFKFTGLGSPSGSIGTSGLWSAADSNPLSGSLSSSGSLTNGDIETGVVFQDATSGSIGIDLGSAQHTTMLMVFDNGSAQSGLSQSGSGDSWDFYESGGNIDWTLNKNYQPLFRQMYSGSVHVTCIACDAHERYLKLYHNAGPLLSAYGKSLVYSEIVAFSNPVGDFTTSGSARNTRTISNAIEIGAAPVRKSIATANRAYTHSTATKELMLRANAWIEYGATQGSIFFGLGTTSGSIANATAEIILNTSPSGSQGELDLVSGSLCTEDIGLIGGYEYDFFIETLPQGTSGSVEFNDDYTITNIADSAQFAGRTSTGDIYVGPGGSSPSTPSSFVYFWREISGDQAAWIKWNGYDTYFEASAGFFANGELIAVNDIKTAGNIKINFNGTDADSYLYFYEGGSATGASLKWDDNPGTFKLSHALDMSTHKITSVVDPVNPQDVVTLNHLVGVVSGSNSTEATLDDVCDNGSTTDQTITAGNLSAAGYCEGVSVRTKGNFYCNYDGPESDSYLYFYEGHSSGRYLKWDDTNNRFEMNTTLYASKFETSSTSNAWVMKPGNDAEIWDVDVVDTLGIYGASNNAVGNLKLGSGGGTIHGEGGNIGVTGNLQINYNGADGDSYLYFYDGSSPTGASLKWDDGNNRFLLSDDLAVVNDIFSNANMKANANIYVNYEGGDGDSYLYFYETNATGRYLKWDDTLNYFIFNDYVKTDGFLTDNAASMQLQLKSSNSTSTHGKILNTGTGSSILYFDASNGDLSGGDYAYIGQHNDLDFHFNLGGNAGTFKMNKGIDIGDGGTTNYTEIKNDGEINLHGTARVNNHVRVAAPSWKLGAAAPTEGFVGVWPTLDFDTSTDDEAHYSLIVPYKMAAGATINVVVDWSHTGAIDTGTVCWGLEYKSIAPGEALTGGTTTITGISAGNHVVDQLVRTQLTTGITGAAAHDVIGLRLYRDVSGDTLAKDAHLIQVHFEFLTDKLGEPT